MSEWKDYRNEVVGEILIPLGWEYCPSYPHHPYQGSDDYYRRNGRILHAEEIYPIIEAAREQGIDMVLADLQDWLNSQKIPQLPRGFQKGKEVI